MKTNQTCLLIDDDRDDQEMFVAAALEANSAITCQVLSDAEEALQLLKVRFDLPDFIFLDVNMPRMNGFQFLRELKRDERMQSIRVIFCSTTKEPKEIGKAMELGAYGFITKTHRYDSLCNILQHFLCEESHDGRQASNFIV